MDIFSSYKEKRFVPQTTFGTPGEMNEFIKMNANNPIIKNIVIRDFMRLSDYSDPVVILTYDMEIEIEPLKE